MCSSSMLPLTMLGFLMLMLSLCDADSICPSDLNTLTLEPDKLLIDFGAKNVSELVNCTSTDEDHDGMYWSFGNSNSSVEYGESFIAWSLSLSDLNETAQCKIKQSDGHECSIELDITLYKYPEMVYVFPLNYATATEGTLYQLQCDIISVAPVQNLTVRWYKNNQIIRTDSFTSIIKTPVTESSVLEVNISRDENGARFRCEAQLDLGPYESPPPFVSNTYTVVVNYAPDIENKSEDVYVDDGSNVTLHCEAEGRPPPGFQWTLDGTDMLENKNYLDIIGVTTNATYICTAFNKVGRVTKKIHVHVIKTTAATVAPAAAAAVTTPEPLMPRACPLILTPAEIVVRFGDSASINCNTTQPDFVGMGWEATLGSTAFLRQPTVLWTVDKLEDWTMYVTCYVFLRGGFQCNVRPNITLYKTPDIVSVSAMHQGPMVEGKEYSLKCDIFNVAPVGKLRLTWIRDNKTVNIKTFDGNSIGPVNESAILNVTANRDDNGAQFKCMAELILGPNGPEIVPTVTSSPHIAVVNYKPQIKVCERHLTDVEHKIRVDMLSCEADGNPPPAVQWYYKGALINASQPLSRTQSGKYTAKFENSFGSTEISVDITVEYGPLFTCNDRYEVKQNDKFPCEAVGIPKPITTWRKDGINVDYPLHLTKKDNGTYTLEATNKHGTTNHTLYLDVLYTPTIIEETYKEKEFTLGENVTLDCIAEGNPPPEILWTYTPAVNARETTGGRQRSIIITRATSTNAGVYNCIATNGVGSHTRSVTLMMKDESKAFPLAIIWMLIVLIGTLIFIVMVVVHNRRKKQGQYSFVPDGADKPIPMTPQSNGVQ
ncbi:intercellular adhesion molecule 5 [Plectropomus leopardus]|uniref:intercellular adhesion molecule 5 n=1 Tax=Plectropomus leopardus TaxID=160734 RepID=UPI001C4CC9AC|nr:intercellular adhesion molecule 5 [Plectropomus leopardus]